MRVFSNRSIVHPDLVRRDSAAVPEQAEKLEAAIAGGQRVLLERFSDAAEHGEEPRDASRVWPLQLLFHNIGWYLAYEVDAICDADGTCHQPDLPHWDQRYGQAHR